MLAIRITPQIKEPVEDLRALGVDLEAARKAILAALATGAQKRVRNRMGTYLNMKTGWLKQHVYGRRRSAHHYVVAAPSFIAEPLERGAVIAPKKTDKVLTFKIGGRWLKADTVTIPARHWFSRSITGYEESTEWDAAVNKGMLRALRAYYKKKGLPLPPRSHH